MQPIGIRETGSSPPAPALTLAGGFMLAFLLSFGPAASNSFARFAYALVLPAMRSDLHWTYAQAGAFNTVNAFGYLLGAILVRLLVGRLGNRPLFCIGMVATAILLWTTGMVRELPALMAVRVLSGIAGAAVFICGGALSGNVFVDRPDKASATIAVYFAGGGLGLLLCGAVIPLLLDSLGDGAWAIAWRWMGYAAFVMSVASIWAALRIAEPGHGDAPSGSVRWSSRSFLGEIGGYLMFALGYIGYMTFIIAWVRDRGGGTATVVALWCVLGLATLAAPLLWAGPGERWRGGRPLAAVNATLALGAAIPLLWSSTAAMMLSAALFGCAMFSAPSSVSTLVKRSLPKPAWGAAMATFTVVFGAGQVVGPVVTGWLADRYDSLLPGLALSVLILLLGSVLAWGQKSIRIE